LHSLTCSHSLYILLTPRPPRSSLFPYTTLFRSGTLTLRPATTQIRATHPGNHGNIIHGTRTRQTMLQPLPGFALTFSSGAPFIRSEEHTSELQSRSDLVCRLLLEKKKKTQQPY